MVYKRYFKKSETPDDNEAVPPEVAEEDANLNAAEEAEDQDPESDDVRGETPKSSRAILAQKLHDYIGKKLGEVSPEKHAAAIRAILSTQVRDPVSGLMKHKYINEDMRKLFKEHPKSILANAPSGNIAPLSHNPVAYTPAEMIGPTASLAIMRIPHTENDHVRASDYEDVQPEETKQPDDEAEDVWLSLGKNTHNLDIMVKSLLRKIANGEI